MFEFIDFAFGKRFDAIALYEPVDCLDFDCFELRVEVWVLDFYIEWENHYLCMEERNLEFK